MRFVSLYCRPERSNSPGPVLTASDELLSKEIVKEPAEAFSARALLDDFGEEGDLTSAWRQNSVIKYTGRTHRSDPFALSAKRIGLFWRFWERTGLRPYGRFSSKSFVLFVHSSIVRSRSIVLAAERPEAVVVKE